MTAMYLLCSAFMRKRHVVIKQNAKEKEGTRPQSQPCPKARWVVMAAAWALGQLCCLRPAHVAMDSLAGRAQTSCVHAMSQAQWHRLTDWKKPRRVSVNSRVRHRRTGSPHSRRGSQVKCLRSTGQLSQSIPEHMSPPDMAGEGEVRGEIKAKWVPVTGALPWHIRSHARCMAHSESVTFPRALPARVATLPSLYPFPLYYTAYENSLLKQLQNL